MHIIWSFVFNFQNKSLALIFTVSVWWNILVHYNNFLLAHEDTTGDSQL